MSDFICYFCGSNSKDGIRALAGDIPVTIVTCPLCGRYICSDSVEKPEYKDIVAAYLYHHERRDYPEKVCKYFLGTENDYNRAKNLSFLPKEFVTIDEIKAFYPRTFSQKIERSLLALAKRSVFFGKTIEVSDDEIQSLLFIHRFDEYGNSLPDIDIKNQYNTILKYFEKAQYIEYKGKSDSTLIELQAEGWKAIEKLQNTDYYNRDVFVAMSFDPSQDQVWEAIKQGIIDARFSPELMKEIIHNKEIVPEMFRLIRECRFLIMDISEPNFGAYYEAGYARGLGKEIIITCSKETHDKRYVSNEEDPCAKYKKPHFDIAQKQILVWKDYPDLTKQLSEWIKALFQ